MKLDARPQGGLCAFEHLHKIPLNNKLVPLSLRLPGHHDPVDQAMQLVADSRHDIVVHERRREIFDIGAIHLRKIGRQLDGHWDQFVPARVESLVLGIEPVQLDHDCLGPDAQFEEVQQVPLLSLKVPHPFVVVLLRPSHAGAGPGLEHMRP
ncbi:hypothetical protein LCM17_18705 [Cereibacter sphaeroides]|nr:hypothetical protein [Cereibacter sphaeroides]